MKPSGAEHSGSENAFAVLMGSSSSSSTKKRKHHQNINSRFALCPVGCGKHVADMDMNKHLDVCLQKKSSTPDPPQSTKTTLVPPAAQQASPATTTSPSPHQPSNNKSILASENGEKEQSTPVSPPSPTTTTPASNNAFLHMMKRSVEVFSKAHESRLAQRFHLNADGSVSLTSYSTNPGLSQPDDVNIEWSATIQVKDKTADVGIDLVVSSSIPSAPNKTRLVKRHSRLSVPVLKSILQKSIRRRKPLPSVRVAMEIADKSMGDLLRRLPIIILEDSTLHPSFPLLTWLMAAHSKNFELPPNLMVKVLCAVYEMASCPWQDHVEDRPSSDGEESSPPDISISSYHKPGIDHTLESTTDAIIWSMLLRAQYGGMACDIRMLRQFATQWKKRFFDGDVPDSIATRVPQSSIPAGAKGTNLQWSNVPFRIHQSASRQSASRVQAINICQDNGIACLTKTDITMEGIDFHCSSILESMLSDRHLVDQCYNHRLATTGMAGLDSMPDDDSKDHRRSWLEGVLKRCMWNYSAGINRRLPFRPTTTTTTTDKEVKACCADNPLKDFWETLLQPRSKAFAEKYVSERLSR
jgi:hypothetical protein